MEELIKLAKLSVGITGNTIKDAEIKLYLKSGIKDIERQGIRANLDNPLVISALIMFFKSFWPDMDKAEKENSKIAYNTLCSNLSLSSDYKEE